MPRDLTEQLEVENEMDGHLVRVRGTELAVDAFGLSAPKELDVCVWGLSGLDDPGADGREAKDLGHSLARAHAGWRLSMDSDDLIIEKERRGRPYVPGLVACGIEMSLAHTTGYVVVASGFDCKIGIDVEPLGRTLDLFALSRWCCTASELAKLNGMPSAEAAAWLLRLWVQKEAIVKALGLGIRLRFSTFDLAAVSGPQWSVSAFERGRHLVGLAIQRGVGLGGESE